MKWTLIIFGLCFMLSVSGQHNTVSDSYVGADHGGAFNLNGVSGGEWYAKWATSNVVYEGHSFLTGTLATQLGYVLNIDDKFDIATGGAVIADVLGRAATVDSKLITETSTLKNILIVFIGTNDITTGVTGAYLYSQLKPYIQSRSDAGWKVFVYTCTPATAGGRGETFETQRNIYNELLRSDLSLIPNVYILDTDLTSELDDPTDTDYYYDQLHPSTLGYELIAKTFEDEILTLSTLSIQEYPIYEMSFNSVQGATLNQVSITFQTIRHRDTLYVDWGEGDVIKVSGITDQTITSTYSTGSTTYDIRIYGELGKLQKFQIASEVTVRNININEFYPCKNLYYIYLSSINASSTGSIDSIPNSVTYLTLGYIGVTVSGSIDNLSNDLIFINISNLPLLTGSLNTLASTVTNLYLLGSPNIDITTGPFPTWAGTEIKIRNSSYSAASIDGFFNTWNATAGYGVKTITTTGNTAPTATSATARTNLVNNLGKTLETD